MSDVDAFEGTPISSDELYHHGVKGMKWYQHIYGEYQSHAKYANGRPDPDKSKRGITGSKEKKLSRKERRDARYDETVSDWEREWDKDLEKIRQKYPGKDPISLYKYLTDPDHKKALEKARKGEEAELAKNGITGSKAERYLYNRYKKDIRNRENAEIAEASKKYDEARLRAGKDKKLRKAALEEYNNELRQIDEKYSAMKDENKRSYKDGKYDASLKKNRTVSAVETMTKLDTLSNKELKNTINRINNERVLSVLADKEVHPGREAVRQIFSDMNEVSSDVDSAYRFHNNSNRVVKSGKTAVKALAAAGTMAAVISGDDRRKKTR